MWPWLASLEAYTFEKSWTSNYAHLDGAQEHGRWVSWFKRERFGFLDMTLTSMMIYIHIPYS